MAGDGRRRIGVRVAVLGLLALAACQPGVEGHRGTAAAKEPTPAHLRPDYRHPTLPPVIAPLPAPEEIKAFFGPGPHVVLIGDSIAESATQETRTKIWKDFGLSWNAVGSTGWPAWTPAAPSIAATDPVLVVVELGTNHLWDGWTRQDLRELSTFLAALGPVQCTVLVGYSSNGHVIDAFGQPDADYGVAEEQGNQALRLQAANRSRLDMPTVWADWSSQTSASTFGPDGVHLTEAGKTAWATWISTIVHQVGSSGSCSATGS